MWSTLLSALGGLGGGFSTLMSDPNFIQYLGGAGAKFGQGKSAGEALDPSAWSRNQQQQQVTEGLLQSLLNPEGTQAQPQSQSQPVVSGGGGTMTPIGMEGMLPEEGPSRLGNLGLDDTPISAPTKTTTAGWGSGGGGGVSPVLPQPQGGGGGGQSNMIGQLLSMLGGVRSGVGGGGALTSPTGNATPWINPDTGVVSPTPIGSDGPDQVITKQTADNTTQTVTTPTERNLSTFGANVPPETQSGNQSPFFKALLSQ